MKKFIFLAAIIATLGLVSCANQNTSGTNPASPTVQGIAAGGLSGGGGGSPQMTHTTTKHVP